MSYSVVAIKIHLSSFLIFKKLTYNPLYPLFNSKNLKFFNSKDVKKPDLTFSETRITALYKRKTI